MGLLGFQGYSWYEANEWLKLGALAVGGVGGAGGLLALKGKLGRRDLYDMRLVQEKIERIAYVAELRLTVFAPADADTLAMEGQLTAVSAAYRQFSLASGNGFAPRRVNTEGRCLTSTAPLAKPRKLPVLNVRELASLWHLPNGDMDVPLLERTAARRYLPLPYALSRGCRIGVSRHHGHCVPIALSDEQLRRNIIAIAKTGRGKSTLMELVIAHLMGGPSAAGNRAAILVIDPHQDLARDVVGFVPPHRQPDLVYLDASNETRPFGLNLIDAGLGWNIDSAVNAALTIFRREFSGNWGPRMESAFRYALRTLYQANEAICAADPKAGRRRQYTILHVPELLVDPAFRRSVIALTNDPDIPRWWTKYFDTMDRHLQAEVINPVQTKIHKFAGSMVARGIVGQACSTIDPKSWIASGAVVIVNTAAGTLGEDTAGLLGSVLVNLVSIALAEQAGLDRQRRRRLTLLVDEMHIMPGISYESIVSELAKYGANLILATQSLARLDVVDRDQERALRATLFSNIDGLFVFNVSAEDAAYLILELGPQVDVEDLVSLPEHHCYVRISVNGDRVPTFSVQLDPPPPSDPALRQRLADESAARYGRDVAIVKAEFLASFERIDALHQVPDEGGIAKDSPAQAEGPSSGTKPRNQHRKGRRKADPHQATVPDKQPPEKDPGPGGQTPLPASPDEKPSESDTNDKEEQP